MADTTTEQPSRPAPAPAQAPAAAAAATAADGAVTDDMLIEEISIDGMCGVY